MAMTEAERADVERLIARVRDLGMGFAALDPGELERLERLAASSANVVWFIDPTLAREKGAAIDRHHRFVKAAVAFARTMRTLLEEEIAELPEAKRPTAARDASSSSPVRVSAPGPCRIGAPAAAKCSRCGARPGGHHTIPDVPLCTICGRSYNEPHAPGCIIGARSGQ